MDDLVDRGEDVLGVGVARPGKGEHAHHPVAGGEGGHAGPGGLDGPGDVPADGERRLTEHRIRDWEQLSRTTDFPDGAQITSA
ncbi:hypothetical protein AB0D24_36655 [Streptomyces javensis]